MLPVVRQEPYRQSECGEERAMMQQRGSWQAGFGCAAWCGKGENGMLLLSLCLLQLTLKQLRSLPCRMLSCCLTALDSIWTLGTWDIQGDHYLGACAFAGLCHDAV